ncbi:MAG: TetR family transcriptional regulator [Actinomycetota bacterium]|nr:TetR family transcriptional regulator [Actinomycetota bacterium]
MTQPVAAVDRAAAARAALRRVVARHGFHGASMGAVAEAAGVATGTVYVHYASKDELIVAAYVEAKCALGHAAVTYPTASPAARDRFEGLWRGAHAYLANDPDLARFLLQVDASPYAERAHLAALSAGDELARAASEPELLAVLVDLPPLLLYDLALGPVVWLVATGRDVDADDLTRVVESCWRAVTR